MLLLAQKYRVTLTHLCLVFLLLLSGVSQIWGQSIPNPQVKMTPSEKNADAKKTPVNFEKGVTTEKTTRKDDSLRAVNQAEKNQVKQPLQEGSTEDKNERANAPLTEKKMTLVVTEDVAEYQSSSLSAEVPKTENKTALPIEVRRPKSKPDYDKTTNPSHPEQKSPDCTSEQISTNFHDPFDAQSKLCYQRLALLPRDPFQKPLAVVLIRGNESIPQTFPNLQFTPDQYQIKRSNAGFKPLWIDWIINYASAEGVDPILVLEVMRWESSFKPFAQSPVGAGGLMQFMPATAARFGINPFDEEQAIMGGSRYLGWLLKRYNGNTLSALAGYNAGEGAVDAFLHCRTLRAGKKVINPLGRCTANGIPPYAETQKYAAGIWANYQMSRKRAEGIDDLRQRIAVNVRFKFVEAVGLNGR